MTSISILGSGWLGRPLAQALAGEGHRIRLSTTTASKLDSLRGKNISPWLVDIRRPREIPAQFGDSEVLLVNITGKDVDAFAGFIAALHGCSFRQVLFVSSTSVYPDCNCEVREDLGLENPDHPLFRIERLFLQAAAFKTSVVRFGGLVGYSRDPARFFASGRAVPNPDGFVNLIHRDDCIAILARIIARGAWGKVFNACADGHPGRYSFYAHCARRAGLAPPVRGEGENYKIIDNGYLKKRLDYSFIHPDPMTMSFD